PSFPTRRSSDLLPARIAEQVAEEINAPPAFAREVDVIDAMIHLRLHPWLGLKARHGPRRGAWPQQTQATMHDRVLAGEAACLQFLHGTLGGDVRALGEQFLRDWFERVDDGFAWGRLGRGRGLAVTLGLHPRKHALHGAARDTQLVGNRPLRHPALTPLHDLQPHRFVHGILSRFRFGPSTNSATTLA